MELLAKILPYIAAATSIGWSITQFWLNWHRIRRKAGAFPRQKIENALGLVLIVFIAVGFHFLGEAINTYPNAAVVFFGSVVLALGTVIGNVLWGNTDSNRGLGILIIAWSIPVFFTLVGLIMIGMGLFRLAN